MENKEQDFINRYKNVQESIVKAMDKALERAIGNKVIDFEKCEGNYLDVYPLIGAALIQAMGMMSENIERANREESLAYTEDSFMKLIQDNGITYNDIIQRGWML